MLSGVIGRISWFGYTSLAQQASASHPREFYEAHLSTEPSQAGQDPWFSQAYEHGGRP